MREEVYCREGMAPGLDRDDTVIRRRIEQKLEFVAEAAGMADEPTDETCAPNWSSTGMPIAARVPSYPAR